MTTIDDHPLGWRPLIAAAALAVIGVALAGSTTTRVFASGYDPRWVVFASVIGGVAALAAHRLPIAIRVLAIVVGGAVGGALAIDRVGGRIATDLPRAALYGVSDLMAATWPTPPVPAGVGVFALLVGVSGGVAVELAGRRRRPACLLPSLAVFGLVAMLGAPGGPPSAITLISYLIASIALLRVLVSDRITIDTARYGALVAALILVAVAVTDSVAVGRYDPRDSVPVVPDTDIAVEPAVATGRMAIDRSARRHVLDVVADAHSLAHVVGLPRYDGRSWLPAEDYRFTGTDVERPLDGVETQQIDVTIGALDTLWWPMIDHAIGTSVPVFVDGTRSALLPDVAPSVGDLNQLAVQVVEVDNAQSAGLEASCRPSPFADDLVLPAWAPELATLITEGATTDVERASRLASYLSNEFVLDPSSPPGHSIAELEAFLQRSRRGRDEQFVTAFAVLAGAIGLPVRVAVGFDTVTDANGTIATSDRVVAWPEVEFDDVGWVRFQPIPSTTGSTDPGTGDGEVAPIDDESAPAPPPSTTPPADAADESDETPAAEVAPTDQGGVARSVVVSVVAVSALVAALVLYAVVIVGLKQRRRRRRRGSFDVGVVAIGAFETGVDAMVDIGMRAAPSATDRELVRAAAAVVPGSAEILLPIADRATETVFSGAEPSPRGALESWQLLDEFEHSSAVELGRWQTARGKLSTRSLRRRTGA